MAIINYEGDIHRDTNVSGDNVYFGNGQGCGTIWFSTTTEARKFIEKHGAVSGQDSGLCEKCSCHYSYGTTEYKSNPAFACKQWKKLIAINIPAAHERKGR